MTLCEMKSSGVEWIGDIPLYWNILKGKYCLSLLQRPILESDEVITCFRDGVVTLRSCRREEGFTVSLKEIGYQGIEPGDIVVHGMDGFAGAIGISDSRGKASPVLIVLDTNLCKKFVVYYLRVMAFTDVFLAQSTGIRIRSCDTSWNKLKNLPYPIPPKNEQIAIANFLDSKCEEIDALCADIEKQIETLEEYKKSVITEAVTKGLDPNVEMKDSGVEWVGVIPKCWQLHPIYFYFTERKCLNKAGKEQNLLSLSYGKIVKKDISTREGLLPASFNTYNIISSGDIVFRLTDLQNDKRSLRTGLSRERGIITSAYVTISPKTEKDTRFYHYLFHAYDINKVFYNLGNGVRQGLNYSELSRLMALEPPKNEQIAIANFLDTKCEEIDAIILGKKNQLDTLAQYKQSLIYEYVTGKKAVPANF